MLIFDEVHHPVAPPYKRIGEMYLAPYRMGLTARLERVGRDDLEALELSGKVIFEMAVKTSRGCTSRTTRSTQYMYHYPSGRPESMRPISPIIETI